MGRDRSQREHRPHDLGPRVYRRGRYWHADLRPWGGGRHVLRNPSAKGWPRKGNPTEDEDIARQWSWKYVALHRSGTRRDQLGLPGEGTPLPDAAKKWIDASDNKVAESTWQSRRLWATSLADRLPGMAIEDVGTEHVQDWLDSLLDQGFATGTVYAAKHTLSAFFRDMVGKGENPVPAVKLPPMPATDARAWTDEELQAIRDEADDEMRPWVELAINTGGRHMELFALTWEQINEKERTVRFTRQTTRYGSGFKPLKGKTNRTAVILPDWWEWHDPDGRGLIMGEWSATHTFRELQKLLDKAGVNEEGASWHRFRHTYARLFLEKSDGAMELLSRSLGHASITTTEQVYGHFRTETAAQLARSRIYGDGTLRIVK